MPNSSYCTYIVKLARKASICRVKKHVLMHFVHNMAVIFINIVITMIQVSLFYGTIVIA
jgi:hypothetical protein